MFMVITGDKGAKLSGGARNIVTNIPASLCQNSLARKTFTLVIEGEASIDDMIAAMDYFINFPTTTISPGTYHLSKVLGCSSNNYYHSGVCFYNSEDEFRKEMRMSLFKPVGDCPTVIGRVRYDLYPKKNTSISIGADGKEVSLDAYRKAQVAAKGKQYRLTIS